MSRLHQRYLYGGVENGRLPELSFGGGQSNANGPRLSFPLGTGLVVLIILFVSAIFSFCYHWLRLRKLGTSTPTSTSTPFTQPPPQEAACDPCCQAPIKLSMLQCPPVVYMAGENLPRFVALPCPFEGVASHKASIEDAEKAKPSMPKLLVLGFQPFQP